VIQKQTEEEAPQGKWSPVAAGRSGSRREKGGLLAKSCKRNAGEIINDVGGIEWKRPENSRGRREHPGAQMKKGIHFQRKISLVLGGQGREDRSRAVHKVREGEDCLN